MARKRSREDLLRKIRHLKKELAELDGTKSESAEKGEMTRRTALKLWIAPAVAVPLLGSAALGKQGSSLFPARRPGNGPGSGDLILPPSTTPPTVPPFTTGLPFTTTAPVFTTTAPTPSNQIFNDGFETGNTSRWSVSKTSQGVLWKRKK